MSPLQVLVKYPLNELGKIHPCVMNNKFCTFQHLNTFNFNFKKWEEFFSQTPTFQIEHENYFSIQKTKQLIEELHIFSNRKYFFRVPTYKLVNILSYNTKNESYKHTKQNL